MKHLIQMALFLLVFPFAKSYAQKSETRFYKGTLNNQSIMLYLKVEPNQCGGDDLISGIYRYGNSKDWLLLTIERNGKGNYCLTEVGFTGVMILKETNTGLSGSWISPEGSKQLPVKLLKQAPVAEKAKEQLEDALEKARHQHYDC